MRHWSRLAWAVVALVGWTACSSEVPEEVKQQAAPVVCPAGQQRACACLGGIALGVQACLASGEGFGACEGCPPLLDAAPQTGGDASVSGGVSTSGGMTASGGEPASGGDTPAASGGALTTGGSPLTSGGEMPAEGAVSETGGSLLDLALPGGASGTACGVALPLLCAPDVEKCCLRSLRTDSCIAASDNCTCELPGCTTTEAYCDGPEDCPEAQVCCGTAGPRGYVAFRCTDSCSDQRIERIACHVGADESPCPTGLICANSQLVSTIQICIDPATIQQ